MEAANSCWTSLINIAKQHGVISQMTYRHWRTYFQHIRGQTHSCNCENLYLALSTPVLSHRYFIEDLVHSVRRSLCTQCFYWSVTGCCRCCRSLNDKHSTACPPSSTAAVLYCILLWPTACNAQVQAHEHAECAQL
jgi:hypothetical protein